MRRGQRRFGRAAEELAGRGLKPCGDSATAAPPTTPPSASSARRRFTFESRVLLLGVHLVGVDDEATAVVHALLVDPVRPPAATATAGW